MIRSSSTEHIDLVIITKQEAAIRSTYADAVAKAEIAAEAGYDAASVIMALEEAVARGRGSAEAVDHAAAEAATRHPRSSARPVRTRHCGQPRSCPIPG